MGKIVKFGETELTAKNFAIAFTPDKKSAERMKRVSLKIIELCNNEGLSGQEFLAVISMFVDITGISGFIVQKRGDDNEKV